MDNNDIATKFAKLAPLTGCSVEADGTFYVRYAEGFGVLRSKKTPPSDTKPTK